MGEQIKQFDLFNKRENIDFLLDEEIKNSLAEEERKLQGGDKFKPRINFVYGIITRLIFKKALPHTLTADEQKEYAKKIAIKLVDMGYKSTYLKEETGFKSGPHEKKEHDKPVDFRKRQANDID